MLDQIGKALAMVVVHVREENGIYLRRLDAHLRQSQQRASSGIELQTHRVAVVRVVAIADQSAGTRLPLVGLRPALRASHRDH